MPAITEAVEKAKKMGVKIEDLQKKTAVYVPPKDYNPNPFTPESSLNKASDGVEYFAKFWAQEIRKRENLTSPDAYLERVNFIFTSYVTVRRTFDASVAYVIGDWLNACRKEFFPGEDRKSASNWNRFLEERLCEGFKKTSANLYMRIADKLDVLREKSLPIQKLEAFAKLVDAGTDIVPLIPQAEELSLSDILAFRPTKSGQKNLTPTQAFNRVVSMLANTRKELTKIKEHGIELKDVHISHIKLEAQAILSMIDANN